MSDYVPAKCPHPFIVQKQRVLSGGCSDALPKLQEVFEYFAVIHFLENPQRFFMHLGFGEVRHLPTRRLQMACVVRQPMPGTDPGARLLSMQEGPARLLLQQQHIAAR